MARRASARVAKRWRWTSSRLSDDQSSYYALVIGLVSSGLIVAGGLIALVNQPAGDPPNDWMPFVFFVVALRNFMAPPASTQR